jgi:polar amino acid transport system permease protein
MLDAKEAEILSKLNTFKDNIPRLTLFENVYRYFRRDSSLDDSNVGVLDYLRNPLFFGPATFYVSIIRGTPLMVQILVWYLALPQVRIPIVLPDGIVLEPMLAGIFALAVCYGAYMTETFRAGIQSISKGQTEAAMALAARLFMKSEWRYLYPALTETLEVTVGSHGNLVVVKDNSQSGKRCE